jgi:hypothetical protein
MATIYMTISSNSMSVQFSELDNEVVTLFTTKSNSHTEHSIKLSERELRELRKFITIQIRKIKKVKLNPSK